MIYRYILIQKHCD